MRYLILALSVLCSNACAAPLPHKKFSAKSCEIYKNSMALGLASNTKDLQIIMFDESGVAFHIGEPPFASDYREIKMRSASKGQIVIDLSTRTIEIEHIDPKCTAWLSRRIDGK